MNEYIVECEECESTTRIIAYSKPEFCGICGRRADAEKRRVEFDDSAFLIEDE